MKALPLKTLAMTVAAGLALAACATATPYQPAGLNGQRGGYAEQRLENNRFRVKFCLFLGQFRHLARSGRDGPVAALGGTDGRKRL